MYPFPLGVWLPEPLRDGPGEERVIRSRIRLDIEVLCVDEHKIVGQVGKETKDS